MLESKIGFLKAWFEIQVELIRFYFSLSNEERRFPLCYTGDVFYAFLGVNIGAEIDKKRPVLVFQSRQMELSHLVFVIPITSKMKFGKFKVPVAFQDINAKLPFLDGTILIDQMRIISKQRLKEKIGRLKKYKILEVQDAVMKLLPYKKSALLPKKKGTCYNSQK